MTEIHWASDAQLMGFGESDSSGAWIKLQVMPEDLEHFRGLKGTVFNVALSIDAEKPGEGFTARTSAQPHAPVKITHMAEWLGARASEKGFAVFLHEAYGVPTSELFNVPEATRRVLGVASRAEVDTDPDAGARCRGLMSRYQVWSRKSRVAG